MAKFRIEDSTKGPPPKFSVSCPDGDLVNGMEFSLYETHHEAKFKIVAVEPEGSGRFTLKVDRVILWNNAWTGTVVDTANPEAVRKGGYGV